MAQAIAQEAMVEIAFILAPTLAKLSEVGFDLATLDAQQGTDNARLLVVARGDHRVNPRQTPGSRAAQELQQDGFGLIVQGVRGRDRIKVLLLGKLREPAIPQLAPCRLDAQLGGEGVFGDVVVPGKELKPMGPGQIRDKSLVCVGLLAPQAMIEVRGGQHDAQLLAKFQQHPQERNRVGAAGNGHNYTVARPQQSLVADVSQHLLAHGPIVRQEAALRLSLFASCP